MNIPPINPTTSYLGDAEPIRAQKSKNDSTAGIAPFRAWKRNPQKTLSSASISNSLLSHQDHEDFWSQWPGKKWRV